MDPLRATLVLAAVPGVRDRTFLRLVRRFGGAVAVVSAGREGLEASGVPGELAAAIARPDWEAADREIEAAARSGARILIGEDPEYPKALAALPDPPPALRVRGSFLPQDVHAAAVVGARDASAYGLAMGRLLGRDLAALGVTVVSGLAIGVDAAAHRGALEEGGRTIAVLGSGLDRVYPARHRRLADEIAGRGALVSELPFGAGPERGHFPRRNRIVSGLALAAVVVEASEASGSLITARLAAEQGREVLAVPGEANAPRTRGTHALLREGAALAERGRDVVAAAMPWLLEDETGTRRSGRPPALETELAEVLERIDRPAVHVDDLVGRSGLSPARALEILLELELRGYVTRHPGMTFSRRSP